MDPIDNARAAALVLVAAQLQQAGLSRTQALAAAPEALERVRAAALRGVQGPELVAELRVAAAEGRAEPCPSL